MKATGIAVRRGGKEILQGVDFEARPGEVTAIVGPNGSGKTTLLQALTGDLPHDGHITLNGRRTGKMKPWDLAALRGVLAQSTTLAFPFSVVEIVRLGLSAGLMAGREELPMRALKRVDLAGFANRIYQELSGGEQQRVQLARVLTQVWEPFIDGQPRWLLLDEPVSSLDIGHQLIVMNIVQGYARAGGGVIAVMHDLNLTAMFADRVSMVHEGRIVASGAPGEVLTNRTLSRAYGCPLRVNTLPPGGSPFLLPQAAGQMLL